MQEINKNSVEIKMLSGRTLKEKFITVQEGQNMFFTKGIVLMCGLKSGEYIHFLNDCAEWMFYSNDNSDGFKLTPEKKSLRVTSAALARLILKTTGFNKKKNFYVRHTAISHDTCPVFKLSPDP